jgi:putative membrane protein insertion efficiency factor
MSSATAPSDLRRVGSASISFVAALPARLTVASIRLYQLTLSRLFGSRCRFHPSCSQYTLEAVSRYGFWRGWGLGLRRLFRCHPFHDGGFDPVP